MFVQVCERVPVPLPVTLMVTAADPLAGMPAPVTVAPSSFVVSATSVRVVPPLIEQLASVRLFTVPVEPP